MRTGIMQPYFLPYFEHFRLINACDYWIVFDIAQYTRKSWISRNRILNRDKGTSYISVPVKHLGETISIQDAKIDTTINWQKKIFDKLRIYESEAPFYKTAINIISPAFDATHESISLLNTELLRRVCNYLEIETKLLVCSSLNIKFPENCGPGEWALYIAKHLSASEYRNPTGGRDLFNTKLFAKNGIQLEFHSHKSMPYKVGSFEFQENLSIIDYLMWNDKETLKSWLQ